MHRTCHTEMARSILARAFCECHFKRKVAAWVAQEVEPPNIPELK